MDDTTYNDDSSTASNSFERRLRLANAAVGIALMGAKLSERLQSGQNGNAGENSGKSGEKRSKRNSK